MPSETAYGAAGTPVGQPPAGSPAPVGTGPVGTAGPGPAPGEGIPSAGPQVGGTRTAATWAALAGGLFFLIVVLVFILQNLKSVRVHFFWATWTIPLAVDLLLATVLGGLVMFTVGSLRILQLRRAARQAGAGRGRGRSGRPHRRSGFDRGTEAEIVSTGSAH